MKLNLIIMILFLTGILYAEERKWLVLQGNPTRAEAARVDRLYNNQIRLAVKNYRYLNFDTSDPDILWQDVKKKSKTKYWSEVRYWESANGLNHIYLWRGLPNNDLGIAFKRIIMKARRNNIITFMENEGVSYVTLSDDSKYITNSIVVKRP